MAGTFIQLPLTGASPFWGNAVSTAASLPAVGDVTGEVLLVLDTASLYYWDGAAWQQLVDGLADVSGPASATDNALALFNGTSGKVIKAASAITASRALASNGSGVPVASATTATELGYVNGVTSAIQTQLDDKEPTITVLPIAKGGTNSGTALSNNRVMASSGGAVVEASAITAARALISDANGIPTHATTTATEIGYLNGVTSAIQTQIDAKAAGAASSTDNAIARYDSTTGKVLQNSAVTIDDNGTLFLESTTAMFRPPSLTTGERDALTPVAGAMIYNETTGRFQGYFDGSWQNLHGWGD